MKNTKRKILLAAVAGMVLLTACGTKSAEEDSSSLYSWEKIPDSEAGTGGTEAVDTAAADETDGADAAAGEDRADSDAQTAAGNAEEADAAGKTEKEKTSGGGGINEASLDKQIEVITAAVSEWGDSDDNIGAPVCIAVTDLDQNGRLEVVRSSMAGSGLFTTSNIWEVNEKLSALSPVTWEKEEGDSEPDLCVDSLKLYYNPSDGTYSYIVPDTIRNGAAETITVTDVFCLTDGEVTVENLGAADTVFTSDTESTTEYTDADGYTITEMDYNGLAAKRFDGLTSCTAAIRWLGSDDLDGDVTGLSTDTLREKLKSSYEGFAITT